MLLERLEITVADGQETAFEAELCEVRQRAFMSPGFRGFTVAQGAEEPSTYLVHVRWETGEELAYFTQSRFRRCWAPVQPFLTARPRSTTSSSARVSTSKGRGWSRTWRGWPS